MEHAIPNCDVLIVGAGAAGLACAIFTARRRPALKVVAIDGARQLGAKILVSGGARCNVTNATVSPDDYWGGSRNVVRRVLAALPVSATVAFFEEIGVRLHREADGKLFPNSNRSRTVLDALLDEARRVGIELRTEHRATRVERSDGRFRVTTANGILGAARLVLATGGMSLPKTGSDGGGYALARSLGHSIVPTTPALVPLLLEGDLHADLSGVTCDARIEIRVPGQRPIRLGGALLWTHFGVSGPLVLDASRHWLRARLDGASVTLLVNFLPGESFDTAERRLRELSMTHPRVHLQNALAEKLPERLVERLLSAAGVAAATPLAHLSREDRRRAIHALLEQPLRVRGDRGYNYAEVTSGGIPLGEIDPSNMQSRCCPGLFLIGEILDVDGRIGGFNFQWAWSSAFAASAALGGDPEARTGGTTPPASPSPPASA